MINNTSELPAPVQAEITDIGSDNRSGAAEIVQRAAAVFLLLQQSTTEPSSLSADAVTSLINAACRALVNAQPAMAPLLNLSAWVISAVSASHHKQLAAAAEAAHQFAANLREWNDRAAAEAAELIKNNSTILTISRSSTVLKAASIAVDRGRQFRAIVTESRPLMEGRATAERLAALNVPTTLIADAAADLFVRNSDLVLIGADSITPFEVINKIGTTMIALAAREADVPMYAVADSSKLLTGDATEYLKAIAEDTHNEAELWADAPEGVLVENRYFEATPIEYFTAIVTDKGLFHPNSAAGKSKLRE